MEDRRSHSHGPDSSIDDVNPHAEIEPVPPMSARCIEASPRSTSSAAPSPMLYTIFTPRQKQLLTFLLGFASITSPLTATIYFPLLPLLRTHFHTSAQAINLTITIYIIFQAVSPALFATLSDSLGRRAVYLITLTLYLLANIGLALNKDSYAALLVLRALQSLGASAAFAVSFGVVADVCVPAERGKMLGPVSMALNLGTCVGPVVGGWVALRSGGYDWVFWFLVVVGGVLLVAVGGFLPETARSVVGNGSLQARRWWETSWWSVLVSTRCRKQSQTGSGNDEVEGRIVHSDREGPVAEKTRKINLGNPLACLRIIFWKDTGLVLWMHGSFYLVDYCIQTAIPSAYKDLYHFNELEIGLSYLPRGTGIILGGYINGRMMDRNYRLTAKKIGHTVNRVSGDDLNHFPIERARTRGSWYLLGTLTIVLIGYGWALEQHSHVSIPLMLQFLQGFLGTCIYTIYNTLLVDIFPESPSTAAAAASITRCALAASGVAALQPLLDTLGRGWFFTALGLASGGAGLVAVWAIQTYGMKWRGQRLAQTTKAREDNVSAHT